MKKYVNIAAAVVVAVLIAMPGYAARGEADFSVFVALGDSYGAGFTGGSLNERHQVWSWPAVIARQVGLPICPVGAGPADPCFAVPRVSFPGISNELVLNSLVPSPVIAPAPGQGQPLMLGFGRPYNNLSIPGATVGALLAITGGEPQSANEPTPVTFGRFILRNLGGTAVDQAIAQHPTFIAMWMCGAALAAGSARAEPNPRRFAVVVGSNRASGERAPLRYAHRDAQAMASALVSVADFPAGQVKLLVDPKPAAVLAALDAQLSAIKRLGGETLLLFYYSGHADQAALYPGGQALPLPSIRARLDQQVPTVRLGIIDACRGGGWTQTKGLTPEAPFEIQRPLSLESEGSVLIASSSGLESAHETEALEGSFFTHHFVAGLLGAADRSGEGEITAEEAFRYARELTVRDTALQAPQPQHPSFEMRLHGSARAAVTSDRKWPRMRRIVGSSHRSVL
jgi:hypothetical protein